MNKLKNKRMSKNINTKIFIKHIHQIIKIYTAQTGNAFLFRLALTKKKLSNNGHIKMRYCHNHRIAKPSNAN